MTEVVVDRAEVLVTHKRDVDEAEDGCVNAMRFTFGAGDGCELTVEAYREITPDGRLAIQSIEFSADSQYPMFPDALEGMYTQTGDLLSSGSGVEGPLSVPDTNSASSCIEGEFAVFLAGTLRGPSQDLEVAPTRLNVSGAFVTAAEDLACPE